MATRSPITLFIAALACAAWLGLPGAAGASAGQESIFQDDNLLLSSGDATRERTLDELQGLGVDTIRAFVTWSALAPAARATRRPVFAAASPAGYAPGDWDRYDELVRSTTRRGLGLILVPTSPIPAWASQCPGSISIRLTCNPNPADFAPFVTALGTRYSGGYGDENGGVLPRVFRWAVFNEANVGQWLTPQFVVRRGRVVPNSPQRYRLLVNAATAGLRTSGHGGDQVMIGETGPIGKTGGPLRTRPVATAEFFRSLFCIDTAGRSLTGRAAVDQGCTRPRRLAATAISHHPYVQGGSRAPTSAPRPDEITIANAGRLKGLMAQAARRGRIAANLPIYYTEFGFQTRPPDRALGVSLAQQATYLNQSDSLAFRDSRIRGVAQYLLVDDTRLGGFQTGLRFADGRAKPGLEAYRFPVHVVRDGIFVRVFGQVRQAANGAREVVRVQVLLPGKPWQTYKQLTTNSKGFVSTRLRSRRGRWRLEWAPADGSSSRFSRVTQEATR